VKVYYDYARGAGNGALCQVPSFVVRIRASWSSRPWRRRTSTRLPRQMQTSGSEARAQEDHAIGEPERKPVLADERKMLALDLAGRVSGVSRAVVAGCECSVMTGSCEHNATGKPRRPWSSCSPDARHGPALPGEMSAKSRHRRARIEGVPLHWVEMGDARGAMPAVLLHGLYDSHRTWKHVDRLGRSRQDHSNRSRRTLASPSTASCSSRSRAAGTISTASSPDALLERYVSSSTRLECVRRRCVRRDRTCEARVRARPVGPSPSLSASHDVAAFFRGVSRAPPVHCCVRRRHCRRAFHDAHHEEPDRVPTEAWLRVGVDAGQVVRADDVAPLVLSIACRAHPLQALEGGRPTQPRGSCITSSSTTSAMSTTRCAHGSATRGRTQPNRRPMVHWQGARGAIRSSSRPIPASRPSNAAPKIRSRSRMTRSATTSGATASITREREEERARPMRLRCFADRMRGGESASTRFEQLR